jgi:hypothetical protein
MKWRRARLTGYVEYIGEMRNTRRILFRGPARNHLGKHGLVWEKNVKIDLK